MTQPLLDIKDLRTYFISAKGSRVVKAVDGVSFTLNEGETLGIVGESGSGKTVTSMSILRLLPPAARGRIC
jgi:ABC-type oligopeptide transport system ATPase subunit